MQTVSTDGGQGATMGEEVDYGQLLQGLGPTIGAPVVLFTTDARGLYDAFLGMLPRDRRQHYECRACRSFIEKYGSLVAIDANGTSYQPFLDVQRPGFFYEAMSEVVRIVRRARVTGVFLSEDAVWGRPCDISPKSPTGEWRHMHVVPHPQMVYRATALKNAFQAAAEKREEHGMLCRALADFPIELARQAHALLTNGQLYRSEKCVGVAEWFLELHEDLASRTHKGQRENLVWRAVEHAPPGFCHVRSTMIGTLLEDLAAGKDFADVKRAFDAKMSPVQYQRPQAAPTDGQIAAAEKVVERLASARALERRYASVEEVLPRALWTPKKDAEVKAEGGVFGHLKQAAKKQSVDLPAQNVTWEKFARAVLPDALSLEHWANVVGPYFAFVTAEDPSAPPILQWDRDDARCPVSWYVYHRGSPARQWGLTPRAWVDVLCVAKQPSGWNGSLEHQGDGAYFLLKGAKDESSPGLGLFPEILKAEYREVRAALEAFSRSKRLGAAPGAPACGVALQKSAQRFGTVFRVTTRAARSLYCIDRWD